MADFLQRDPRSPAFWDERFERAYTPWDRGAAPQALREFVAASAPRPSLIPGCGAAHELVLLADAGWDACAIDFAPAAVQKGRAVAGRHAARVVEADFFAWQPQGEALQLIYERAFLCALPPAMRPQVAARWAALLPPGGLLVGYFFFDHAAKGPPFGIARSELEDLLGGNFDCLEDQPVSDSIAVFEGKERWMIWQRRAWAQETGR
ncbi:methyltransferase domain-containing protein [Duganella qianjiadongensis]|uniref:Methyltransferase domain-containing protein n=1 Tax=Duganella qianjiadongensis TaxID=2692176 RepID=A0ABW9VMY2_9BURK|nr:methyltransferase domain-containing protein [Duganella qianjiadongensis]MYM40948.1 methyltransferase domain-containing protein [Duganella qianjiadongensis]